jgi:hypothetical protein
MNSAEEIRQVKGQVEAQCLNRPGVTDGGGRSASHNVAAAH